MTEPGNGAATLRKTPKGGVTEPGNGAATLRKTPKEGMEACVARRLPRHHWKLLRPVPGWDGVLYYDPLDFELDRPLTFYRRLHHRQLGEIRYPVKVYTVDREIGNRKKGGSHRPRFQRTIKIKRKGVTVNLFCSNLTMHCQMGFTIADPRHCVVDHINGDSTDDRPSNLQVISQSENCRRSQLFLESALRNLERAQQVLAERRRQRRLQVAAAFPSMETTMELDIEIALQDLDGGTRPQANSGTRPQGDSGTRPQADSGTRPQANGGARPQAEGGARPQADGKQSTQKKAKS